MLQVPSNMKWAKSTIPANRAKIKDAIANGRVANINQAI